VTEVLDTLAIVEFIKAIKYIAAAVAVAIFLVFFAVAPFHALILCGLFTVLGSMALKLEKENQQIAIIVGAVLMAVGTIAILVPQVSQELLSIAGNLGTLLRLHP